MNLLQETRDKWIERFRSVGSAEWPRLKHTILESGRPFYGLLWWNVKYFEFELGKPFNGLLPHRVARKSESEIPDERRFGHCSNGRFALPNHPVSYWAGDYSIARNEITEGLRNDKSLTLAKMISFVAPNILHPIHCRIRNGIPILDLTDSSTPFFKMLPKYGICSDEQDFYDRYICSRDPDVYPVTQAIAQCAFEQEFAGIVWRTVRSPIDSNPTNDRCVVLFDDDYIVNVTQDSSNSGVECPPSLDEKARS